LTVLKLLSNSSGEYLGHCFFNFDNDDTKNSINPITQQQQQDNATMTGRPSSSSLGDGIRSNRNVDNDKEDFNSVSRRRTTGAAATAAAVEEEKRTTTTNCHQHLLSSLHPSYSYQQQQPKHAQQQQLLASSSSPTSPPYAFVMNQYASREFQRLWQLPYSTDGCCILAGVMAFGTTLCASTWTQQRLLGISTGTLPPIPSLVGFVTVCVASTAAHRAAIATQQYVLPMLSLPSSQHQYRYYQHHLYRDDAQNDDDNDDQSSWTARAYYHPYPSLFSWHTVRVCAVGLLAFKVLLGGRFWAISPSSYTHLGSFARPRLGSLPATENYASTAQREVIQKLGKRFGCHTCGTRGRMGGVPVIGRLFKASSACKTVEFVGDHMPPKSVADQLNQRFYRRLLNMKVSFRFYPQCTVCSDRQGSLLSQATAALRKHQADKVASSFLKLGGKAGGSGGPSLPSLAASTAGCSKSSCFHGWKFRFHHLTGGIVAAATVVNVDHDDDISDGNQRRFANWQYQTMNRLVLDPLSPYMPSSFSPANLRYHGRQAQYWIKDNGRQASYWIQDNGRYAQEWVQVQARQTNDWLVQNSRQAHQWIRQKMRRFSDNSNNSPRRR
jgi:hypothetical protein